MTEPGVGVAAAGRGEGAQGQGAGAAPGLDDVAERALVEIIRSAARMTAAAEAVGLAAIAELARRREESARVDPLSAPVDDEERARFVATEIGAILRLSPAAARDRLALAADLAVRLPATRAALAAGRIGVPHARRVHEAVADLPDEVAADVEAAVMPRAGTQTPGQLGACLRRAVLRAEPDGGWARCRRAEARRCVRVHPGEDGQATLSVVGRADLVVAAYERVSAVARGRTSARATAGRTADDSVGEPVGLEQARADVALELLAGDAATLSAVAGVSVTLGVVAPVGAVLGADDAPGELAGLGPLPAPVVRELASDASWYRWWTQSPPSSTRGTAAPADPPALADPGGGQVEGRPAGVLVDVGRRRYRPSAALADAVRARDAECRFPTCRRRASASDVDHVVPFARGGATARRNLLTLCRHHHRLKHRAGWRVAVGPDGTDGEITWISPAGDEVRSLPRQWPNPPRVVTNGSPAGEPASPPANTQDRMGLGAA